MQKQRDWWLLLWMAAAIALDRGPALRDWRWGDSPRRMSALRAARSSNGCARFGRHPSHRPPRSTGRGRLGADGQSLTGLYCESRAIVWRHHRRPLTVAVVARALVSSPRPVQRAFVEVSFSAHLRAVRLCNAAQLLGASR
jgi:transcriptional regulator GlxA family with amidase domain